MNISGAVSGALNPESKEARKHAKQYYKSVRNMKTDIISIANNLGMNETDIQKIKNYLFIDKHELFNGFKQFDESYHIAQSWQRLIDGKNIKEQDIILIKHELEEMEFIKNGMTQTEAHIEVTKRFNYYEASEKGV